MRSAKNQIRFILHEALQVLGIPPQAIVVEYPEQSEHGDYSSPAAMGLARELKKNPRQIAGEIKAVIDGSPMFERVEIAGPGFLNFFLSEEYLAQKLNSIDSDFGKNNELANHNMLIEYVSANPTGPLHIGHGRWAAVGDSLARVLEFSGAEVYKEFYVNDAGVQISHLQASVDAVIDGNPVPEDGYHGAYIKELAEEVSKTGKTPQALMQEHQQETLAKFRSRFDNWFSEKSLTVTGAIEDTFEELKQKNSVYSEGGALWFKSTEYGRDDKDRVLIKGDGSLTYFASDIAYHREKIKRGYPILINILGFDHHGYVERISAAVKVMGGNQTVLLGQMVNLFRDGEPVRMSKRTGDMITLDEVIEEIGTDAARYILLRRPMNSSVDFDLETAKNASDDNPVYYVQYAHARISSIMANSDITPKFDKITHPQERRLLLEALKFEDLVLEIARTYELHKIPHYLEALAGSFHRFYRECRIIGQEEEASRLALSKAVKNVFFRGLELLGVDAPEKM